MCGIAGYWKPGINPDNGEAAKKMIKTLHHRGPDGYGFHFDDGRGLAMAHARLSIIDLQTGDQPLYNSDQSNVLTVNGEFYDYKRIRTELRLDGAEFRTKSDSEIALPLYQRRGLNFVEQLRGEFAFTLFDGNNNRLILVRDRFGVKPLFFHFRDNGIYWGSEVKALLAHPNVPAAFSRKAVLHQLMHTMVPGTTAFEDVHAVKPGHMLIVQAHGDRLELSEHKYWDVNFPAESERDLSLPPEGHIAGTREKLTEAVALRLEADVPVGCYLSGGIDSCSMLGLASSIQQSPVKAFTISFDHDAYDESTIAKEMAAKVNADHEQISLGADQLYGQNYVTTLWHAERTFYNTLGVAKWCMSRRVNECGYRVVVTGEGADELYGGYPAFKRDMLRFGMHGRDQREVEAWARLMDRNNSLFQGAILSEQIINHPAMDDVCGFTPSWIQPWIQTLELARPLLHDQVLDELGDYDPITAIAESFDTRQLNDRHVLDKAQYTWIKTMLECQILNWGGDRVDMANSMESRPAFLDHHVADAAKWVPPHYRIYGNIEKWVLREAMKNILPEVLYKREKFAFMAPPGHTDDKKKHALDTLMREFMNEDMIREVGLFDSRRLVSFVEAYKRDSDPVSLVRKDALINHILGLHILWKHFVGEKVADRLVG